MWNFATLRRLNRRGGRVMLSVLHLDPMLRPTRLIGPETRPRAPCGTRRGIGQDRSRRVRMGATMIPSGRRAKSCSKLALRHRQRKRGSEERPLIRTLSASVLNDFFASSWRNASTTKLITNEKPRLHAQAGAGRRPEGDRRQADQDDPAHSARRRPGRLQSAAECGLIGCASGAQ
jgi:hypothetical protein